MTDMEISYISSVFSEAYQNLGFPVMFYKSTLVRDKFNHASVSLVPASGVVYAVFSPDEVKDADFADSQTFSSSNDNATIKVVLKDLFGVGISKVSLKDVVELTLHGETAKYLIVGFSDKNELPNIFVKLRITRMQDINVGTN